MESFDFKTSLQIAIEQNPQEIIFVNKPRASYANLKFYSYLVENPKGIPIKISQKPVLNLDRCILYHQWNEKELDQLSYAFTEHKSNKSLNFLERLLRVKPYPSRMKVRCYR